MTGSWSPPSAYFSLIAAISAFRSGALQVLQRLALAYASSSSCPYVSTFVLAPFSCEHFREVWYTAFLPNVT